MPGARVQRGRNGGRGNHRGNMESVKDISRDAWGGDSEPLPLPRGDAAALEDALPGYGAAAATPSLARELRRALDGI